MNWRKRIPEWLAVIRWNAGRNVPIPWLHMLAVILGGPVPRAVWRSRIRTCLRCPLYRADLRACSSIHPEHLGLGCGCHCPVTCLFAEPYKGGCIARSWGETEMGWPAYRYPSIWHRLWAPIRFLLGR